MIQKGCFLVAVLFMAFQISAQVEFTHLQYNLTLYGNPFACDEANNNSDVKDAALSLIIDHVQPDIFTVNEMRDSDVWAERLLDNVLNDDADLWSRADLTDEYGWSSIVNACYYRNDRFTLYDQEVVYQSLGGDNLLRHLDLYTLYMELPSLLFGDTAFVSIAVAHLSAGDSEERANQTEALMAYIEGRGIDNYIFTGDLNMDSSSEEAYQNLIAHPDPDFSFQDPMNANGTWHNNFNFSDLHTQSTRFNDTNSGCFSGSGLDDRFDITLISPYISSGAAGVSYVSGSYEVVGQSGNDYNQELQTVGNQVVPTIIAQALYDFSDHLPVKTSYVVDLATGLVSEAELLIFDITVRDGQLELWVKEPGAYLLAAYDMQGRLVSQEHFRGRSLRADFTSEKDQVLILQLIAADGSRAHRIQFIR